MDTVFSGMLRPVTVSRVEMIDEQLRKIRFEGDLSRTRFTPGNVIEFRVSDTAYRHYTPCFYDKENGICEVLFYLHDKGEGSQWAANCAVGDEMKLMGPGGRISYNPRYQHHFFFGDETSLGLFQCMKAAADQHEQEYLCLLELEDTHRHWPSLIGLPAEVLPKRWDISVDEILDSLSVFNPVFWQLWQDGIFYLSGRAKSIQALRKGLLRKGVPSGQIKTEPYWSEGKKGL